jgi:asparagine synthase (glutamine-hydrolysing)
MRALERWGEEAVDRLVGDFAFALWDGGRERLLLARDFLGQRPLHYHRGDGFFAFASMPKGLHALPEVPLAPNRQAVADFLALMPETGTETFFEGIEKVRRAISSIVTRDGLLVRKYWQPPSTMLRLGSPDEYAEALREQLDRPSRRGCAAPMDGSRPISARGSTAAPSPRPRPGCWPGRRPGHRLHLGTAPRLSGRPSQQHSRRGPARRRSGRPAPNIDHVLVAAAAPRRSPALDR